MAIDEVPGFECKMCGDCCRLLVPVTLLDVDRLARGVGVSEEEMFAKCVGAVLLPEKKCYTISKNADGWCVFRGPDNRCAVYEARPWVCATFICDASRRTDGKIPWSLVFDNEAGRDRLWEHFCAQEHTKTYVARNGMSWLEADYAETIERIGQETGPEPGRYVRAARVNGEGLQVIQYNCRTCPHRVTCCANRPLTIDDVRRIAAQLKMPHARFFTEYVSSRECPMEPGLLTPASDDRGRCRFLDHKRNACTLGDARPIYCRLMPCPLVSGDAELTERFFAGAGSIEEQFHYQVGVAVTRQYVARAGVGHDAKQMATCLDLLDGLVSDAEEFSRFLVDIAPCRYEQEGEDKGALPRSR